MSVGYDAPDRTIEREKHIEAGGAATTAYGKFRSLFAAKLTRVKAWVTTQGTAVGHGFDVYVGTTSVGTIPLGTSAAETAVEVALNVAAPAGSQVSVKSLADIVGKADVTIEYRRAD